MASTKSYRGSGVSFRYPADWTLSQEQRDRELTVTVSSPNSAFWSVTILFDSPTPQSILRTAVRAFRDEYDNVDVYKIRTRIADREAVGRNLDFICVDLVSAAFLRAFSTESFSVLVFFQATDVDLEESRSVFSRISRSLSCYPTRFAVAPEDADES